MGYDASSAVHFTVSGFILGLVFLFLVLDLLFRYYIGKSAITESKRQHKKGILYIIMAFVLCLSLIGTLFSRINTTLTTAGGSDMNTDPQLDTVLASNLVDLTALIALVEMIIAAFMVRHLRKQLDIDIPTKKEWKREKKERRLQKKEIKKQKRAQEI